MTIGIKAFPMPWDLDRDKASREEICLVMKHAATASRIPYLSYT